MLEIPWILFISASLVVIIAPGQDLILVMSRGLGQGARAGVITSAGVSVGLLGHSVVAGLGLGALLSASATAYAVMKYLGAAYLFYLGIRLLLSAESQLNMVRSGSPSSSRLFTEGALSNLSNPKVMLFYFAFLPQFVPASTDNASLLIFLLGVVFALLTFTIKAPIGLFAGAMSNWFNDHPTALKALFRTSGLTMIGLGVRLVFEERTTG